MEILSLENQTIRRRKATRNHEPKETYRVFETSNIAMGPGITESDDSKYYVDSASLEAMQRYVSLPYKLPLLLGIECTLPQKNF